MKLGQNFVKYFVGFLGNGVSRKNTFEIYWPLKDVYLIMFNLFIYENMKKGWNSFTFLFIRKSKTIKKRNFILAHKVSIYHLKTSWLFPPFPFKVFMGLEKRYMYLTIHMNVHTIWNIIAQSICTLYSWFWKHGSVCDPHCKYIQFLNVSHFPL